MSISCIKPLQKSIDKYLHDELQIWVATTNLNVNGNKCIVYIGMSYEIIMDMNDRHHRERNEIK